MIGQILQIKNDTSLRCEIGHTFNSMQTRIQSTHSVNESCVTVSKGKAHTNSSEKSLHELTVKAVCSSLHVDLHDFILQTAQDISSLALPLLPVYNQTVLPFMLTYALLSFIVHDGFI